MKRFIRRKRIFNNTEMLYFYIVVFGMFAVIISCLYVDRVLAETRAESAEARIEYIERVTYKYKTFTRIKYIEVEPTPVLTDMGVPQGKGQFISILRDFNITRQGSRQLAYVTLGTPDEQGLYVYLEKFMVAMGSHYGDLGTCFKVTLSNGRIIEVIMTERKADEHTDRLNMYTLQDGSVLEFIVDESKLPKGINGNIANVLGGYPVRIERMG